ncbi:MAG: nucleotidyltransferase domain-containing protein [Spirochaetia bacterium]
MTERHNKAIEELTRLNKDNPKNIALIICGSIATKEAGENSDIDLYLVVTDEEMKRVAETKSYFYGTWDPNKFYGIEIDGKIVGMQFLRDAVKYASDPTRLLFSKSNEVDELIPKICVYPEWEQAKRIRAFYAYVKHFRYVGEAAFKQGNEFFAKHCVMELVFFAGRLVLTHNHMLFPCRKAFFKALGECKHMPAGFIPRSRCLMGDMNLTEMLSYYETVINYFIDYDYPDTERIGLVLENEWTWYTKKPTISEW